MSMLIRRFACSLTIVTLFAGIHSVATAQPDDLLKKLKSDQSILRQRLQKKMEDAVADAQKLQPVSQVRAVNVLKTALTNLDDPLVPPEFRKEWTTRLSGQIKAIESGKKVADPVEINPAKREIREANAKRAKAIQEEYSDVRRSLDTISSLVKSGSQTQAQRETEALQKRHPDNPAVLVMAENISMTQRIADAKVLVDQQKQGYLLAMRSVDKSAIPANGEIEFDRERFKEITKLRVKPLLTKKERAILKALETPINLGYKDAPFDEVLKAISTATGLNVLMDKGALQAAMIESNTPTSITLRGGSARTALRKVLQDHNLTFIIKNESIQVVTLDQARTMLVTRVYYIGDLVQLNGPFGGAVKWGPWLDFQQMQENAKTLVEMVKAIDPESWQGNGGIGSVIFNGPSNSLIVRQTAEVHAMLGGSIGGGR